MINEDVLQQFDEMCRLFHDIPNEKDVMLQDKLCWVGHILGIDVLTLGDYCLRFPAVILRVLESVMDKKPCKKYV